MQHRNNFGLFSISAFSNLVLWNIDRLYSLKAHTQNLYQQGEEITSTLKMSNKKVYV